MRDPTPGLVDPAAMVDELGAAGVARIYNELPAQTKAIDPAYDETAVFPPGDVARRQRVFP